MPKKIISGAQRQTDRAIQGLPTTPEQEPAKTEPIAPKATAPRMLVHVPTASMINELATKRATEINEQVGEDVTTPAKVFAKFLKMDDAAIAKLFEKHLK